MSDLEYRLGVASGHPPKVGLDFMSSAPAERWMAPSTPPPPSPLPLSAVSAAFTIEAGDLAVDDFNPDPLHSLQVGCTETPASSPSFMLL